MVPVVTLATGKDSHDMPVGLQLVARQGRDADLIRAAATSNARWIYQPFAP